MAQSRHPGRTTGASPAVTCLHIKGSLPLLAFGSAGMQANIRQAISRNDEQAQVRSRWDRARATRPERTTHMWYDRVPAECEARAAKRAHMPGFRRRQSHGPFPRLPAYKMQANIRSRNLFLINPVGIAPGELTQGVRHRGLPNGFNVSGTPVRYVSGPYNKPRAYVRVVNDSMSTTNPWVWKRPGD